MFMDKLTYIGDASKGFTGLINSALVTQADAIADGTGNSPVGPGDDDPCHARRLRAAPEPERAKRRSGQSDAVAS
jgi:hypothetical protein